MYSAIILGAGSGTRMKAPINKQFLTLAGIPILSHTLKVFAGHSHIDEIILVINPLEEELIREKILNSISTHKTIKIAYGGKVRQESVYNGLRVLHEKSQIVLIHDGARPLITKQVLSRAMEGAKKHGSVVTGVPAKETIKIVKEDGLVDFTPKREELWITQTPQAFQVKTIIQAHNMAKEKGFIGTDDAMLIELMGENVRMIMGDYENIKITTPEDLVMAEEMLKLREMKQMNS